MGAWICQLCLHLNLKHETTLNKDTLSLSLSLSIYIYIYTYILPAPKQNPNPKSNAELFDTTLVPAKGHEPCKTAKLYVY